MGDWKSLGQELVDSYMTGEEEDMQELAQLIRERIGCCGCEAKELCDNYKDSVYNGECAYVLDSFFADTEDEDTREQREKEEQEARRQETEDWHSWYYRD